MTARTISLAILPNQLPANFGIGVHYALPPYAEWVFIGVINTNCPSATWDAPWCVVPETSLANTTVQLGLSVMSNVQLKELWERNEKTTHEYKINYAKRIARNLVDYLLSFGQGGDMILVSQDRLEKWFEKFCRRLAFDKKFMKE